MSDVTELIKRLRKRAEPDSGIRYEEVSPYNHAAGPRVEIFGSDATFIANHFHGRGAADLAEALERTSRELAEARELIEKMELIFVSEDDDPEDQLEELFGLAGKLRAALQPTEAHHADEA